MPGPVRKNDAIRRNSPDVVDMRAYRGIDPPPPPEGLLKSTREWWDALWRSDLTAATHAATDIKALERLATLHDLRERAAKSVRNNMLVPGSQGQMVLNPLARQMSTWDSEIRQLEDRFGLTPRARLNLGITLGQARKTAEDLLKDVLGDDEDEDDPRDIIDL